MKYNYLRNISSYSYCTSNEDGMQEVTVEYENGLIRSLLRMPKRKLVLVAEKNSILYWRNKETMEQNTEYYVIALQVKKLCSH